MNDLVQHAVQLPVAPMHQPLVPHWLTHLGTLGLFFGCGDRFLGDPSTSARQH